MGRPREHDDETRDALLSAAERIVEREGIEALSVRRVAGATGTTTRAVYTVFGSKEGLLVALGIRSFGLLRDGLGRLTTTADPSEDLIAAGLMFRAFVRSHPSLFAIGVQRNVSVEPWGEVASAASTAMADLRDHIARLADVDRLGGRTVGDAAWQFHALCEGLAALELRGLGGTTSERMWREALTALVLGFAIPVA